MNKNKQVVPPLRFKDKDGKEFPAWEQRKLKDISRCFSGGTPSAGQQEFYGGDIPFIRSGEISGSQTELTLTRTGLEKSAAKMVDKGTILYALYGATSGEVSRSRIRGAINQAILAIEVNEHYSSEFVHWWLRNRKQKIVGLYLQGGQGNLSGEIVKNLTLDLPSKKEQDKIGEFFRSLEDTITLHQRKLEQLKKLKKSLLQKMFPKEGELYPELRFPGFTDAWEQRKCKDFLIESKEKGHTGDIAKKLTVKLWGNGITKKDVIGSPETQYFIRHAEQFIYSKLDFLNCAFAVIPKELDLFESTADLPAFDCHGINPYFMFYTAIDPNFYLKNGICADGSRKAKRIHVETFLDMPIKVPSMSEQTKIVNFLRRIENNITLHQRKLDSLKKLKQGLLQNMFV